MEHQMGFWTKLIIVMFGLIIIALILAVWIGLFLQNRTLSRLIEMLLLGSNRVNIAQIRFNELEHLPPPVARFFRRVLKEGQAQIRVAHYEQAGTLRTDMRSDRWLSFKASQVIAPFSPGFVWNACVRIAPLLYVSVLDAYVAGQGSGQVSLFSAFTVAADRDSFEINSGALHRYLAEAVWYPTALLPSEVLHWSPINNNKALAVLTDGEHKVSLEFWFNDEGEVTGIYSPGRWGRFGGKYKQLPWEGHFWNYEERDGMMISTEGEVGWYSEGEWLAVWKGKILGANYQFAQ
jgi:hypothetical protein